MLIDKLAMAEYHYNSELVIKLNSYPPQTQGKGRKQGAPRLTQVLSQPWRLLLTCLIFVSLFFQLTRFRRKVGGREAPDVRYIRR